MKLDEEMLEVDEEEEEGNREMRSEVSEEEERATAGYCFMTR